MQGGGGDWAISLDKHDEEHGTEPKQRYEEEDSVHKYVCVCVCVCECVMSSRWCGSLTPSHCAATAYIRYLMTWLLMRTDTNSHTHSHCNILCEHPPTGTFIICVIIMSSKQNIRHKNGGISPLKLVQITGVQVNCFKSNPMDNWWST